ncbi:MAG: hypothetical protein P8L22_06440 [Acidimicrobiales bacterium]|nr:hypothetical protein [Acidimicrobiales bacterium]
METRIGTEPLRNLTQEERSAYESDGVVLVSDVLDLGWVDLLCDAFEVALTNPGTLQKSTPQKVAEEDFSPI